LLRQIRKGRNLSIVNEPRTDHPTSTDCTDAFTEARKNLVPMIAGRTANALKVDPVEVLYFQRKRSGRRCSCFNGGDSSPDGLCQVCWGTGLVIGFEKYGTRSAMIDVTHPNLKMVNVHPAYELHTRPVMFVLDNEALDGYIEATVPLLKGTGVLDCVQLLNQVDPNSAVTAQVRGDTEGSFVDLTNDAVEARLLSYNALVFRILLGRADFTIAPPVASHLFIRYNLKEDLLLIADQPRQTESIALQEFGIFEQFSSISFVFGPDFNVFSNNDFFVRLRDNRRFKIIEVQKNEPLGITTSTDVQARLVQDYDVYARIP